MFRSGRVRNFLLLAGAAIMAFLLVRASPAHAELSFQMWANTFNTTVSMLLILFSPLFRLDFRLSPSRYADIGIITFLAVGLALSHLADAPKAWLQIGSFSIVLYVFISDTLARRIIGTSAALIGGARIIFVGIVLGFVLVHRRWVAHLTALLLLATATYGLLYVVTFDDIQTFLGELRSDGILMKGRITYWLALTMNEPTLFGNGAGSALLLIEAHIGQFQLPHNDYLRVFTDYGAIPLMAIVIVLARNGLRKEVHKRLGTVLLAFYMLTGNPLSFPTVVVSYLLFVNTTLVPPARSVRNGNQVMLHLQTRNKVIQ